jgi:hypothetical protein
MAQLDQVVDRESNPAVIGRAHDIDVGMFDQPGDIDDGDLVGQLAQPGLVKVWCQQVTNATSRDAPTRHTCGLVQTPLTGPNTMRGVTIPTVHWPTSVEQLDAPGQLPQQFAPAWRGTKTWPALRVASMTLSGPAAR